MSSYQERIGKMQEFVNDGWNYIQNTITSFNQDCSMSDDARFELLNYLNNLNTSLYNEARNLADLTLSYRLGILFNQPLASSVSNQSSNAMSDLI